VRVKSAGRPRPPLRRLEDERRDSDVVLSLSGKKYIGKILNCCGLMKGAVILLGTSAA
jgi:hypothetical protein